MTSTPTSETKALEGHSKPVVDTQLLYRITPGWGKVVARCRGQCVYELLRPLFIYVNAPTRVGAGG